MKRVPMKLLSLLLVLCLMLGMASCSNGQTPDSGETEPVTSVTTDETTGDIDITDEDSNVTLTMEGDDFGNGAIGENAAVSSYSAISSQIGIDILKAGGNAVDAAVAVAFAVGVIEPHHSGIGGSGLMTIYLADEDKYITIDYLETCPAGVTEDYYSSDLKKTVRAAAVPGQVAGLAKALDEYGTMTLAEVLEPVIDLCYNGFELESVAAGAIADGYATFTEEGYEYLYELYTDDGIPYSAGDTFKNEDLGDTLSIIAEQGADAFYKGELAEKMVAAIQEAGGCMTMEDFANYEAVEYEPISTDYYGYEIVTQTNPTCGGVWMLESLNIMESLDIAQYEVGSAEYLKVFNEAVRYGMMDAYQYAGDPEFYDLPTDTLITQEYADERAELFSMDSCVTTVPSSDLGYSMREDGGMDYDEPGNTTHIAVIDEDGNIVSTTNTIGIEFGCYFAVEGLGFPFNSHLANLNFTDPTDPDYIAAGKRVHSSMAPTIVTKDGEPVMALGSPGSLVIPPAIMSVINNTLLYDMNIQQAINYPRAFTFERSSSTGPKTIITAETDRMDETTIRQLEVYGYEFTENVGDYNAKMGGIAAVYIDNETGLIYAGGDPRRNYQAIAY